MLPASGVSPRRTKRKDSFASGVARRMSQSKLHVSPRPTATPFIAHMVGLGNVRRREIHEAETGLGFGVSPLILCSKLAMSAPEQNARPAPVRMITPISSSLF